MSARLTSRYIVLRQRLALNVMLHVPGQHNLQMHEWSLACSSLSSVQIEVDIITSTSAVVGFHVSRAFPVFFLS